MELQKGKAEDTDFAFCPENTSQRQRLLFLHIFSQLFSHFSEKRVKNGIGRRKNPCSSENNSRKSSLSASTKYKTGYHHHNHIHFRCHPHHQDDNHDDQVARPVRERQGEGGKISAFRRNVYKVTVITLIMMMTMKKDAKMQQ